MRLYPYVAARAIYDKEWCARSFDEDLGLHLHGGLVFNTPDFFLMGRCVPSGAPPDEIVDPAYLFTPSLCDCWHVHVLAGDAREAWSILPYPMRWMSYQRNNVLRIKPLRTMQRLLSLSKITP